MPNHNGHTIDPLADVALESRGRVAQLLYESPVAHAEVLESPVAMQHAGEGTDRAELVSKSVVAVRQVARRIAARLASLPDDADAALAHVSSVQEALIAAITERATQISDEIRTVVAAKEEAIRNELAAADAELSRVTFESAVLARALSCDGLSDVDIIMHEEVLASVLQRSAGAFLARPLTSSWLEMRSSGRVFMTPALVAGGGLEAHVEAAVRALGELTVGGSCGDDICSGDATCEARRGDIRESTPEDCDIAFVCGRTNASRISAIFALRNNGGDVVDAILSLTP